MLIETSCKILALTRWWWSRFLKHRSNGEECEQCGESLFTVLGCRGQVSCIAGVGCTNCVGFAEHILQVSCIVGICCNKCVYILQVSCIVGVWCILQGISYNFVYYIQVSCIVCVGCNKCVYIFYKLLVLYV